jgi:LemA protein
LRKRLKGYASHEKNTLDAVIKARNVAMQNTENTDIENRIQAIRRFYSSNVLAVNAKLELFPGNIISGAFGFAKRDFFKLDGIGQDTKKLLKFRFNFSIACCCGLFFTVDAELSSGRSLL